MPLAVAGDTLYAVGGLSGQSFIPERTLWAYREDVNRWEARAPLPAPRGASGAAAVDGRLVVVGGWGAGRRLRSEERRVGKEWRARRLREQERESCECAGASSQRSASAR